MYVITYKQNNQQVYCKEILDVKEHDVLRVYVQVKKKEIYHNHNSCLLGKVNCWIDCLFENDEENHKNVKIYNDQVDYFISSRESCNISMKDVLVFSTRNKVVKVIGKEELHKHNIDGIVVHTLNDNQIIEENDQLKQKIYEGKLVGNLKIGSLLDLVRVATDDEIVINFVKKNSKV